MSLAMSDLLLMDDIGRVRVAGMGPTDPPHTGTPAPPRRHVQRTSAHLRTHLRPTSNPRLLRPTQTNRTGRHPLECSAPSTAAPLQSRVHRFDSGRRLFGDARA